APLEPGDRAAFRSAAENALVGCSGEGQAYRTLRDVCARLEPRRERVALYHLGRVGFETYCPRLREHRRINGRRALITPPLFPRYAFFVIESQWHAARWSIGVLGLIMDGLRPARVADSVISEIKARERGGLVELPRREEFRTGDHVRVRA